MKYKFLFLLFIFLILFKGFIFSFKYVEDEYNKDYTLFIEGLKSISNEKVSYYVTIKDKEDKFILNIYNDKYKKENNELLQYLDFNYGDVVKVKGKIKIPKKLNNPGEFNYKLYLYSNNIHGLINTYDEVEKVAYTKNIFENMFSKIYEFKSYINKVILASMEEKNAETAMALIYGDRTELDENIKEDFENLGVSHLMSVSGAHITSFMYIVNFILNSKKNSNIKRIIIILSVILYVIFTGSSISSLRAGIMLITSIICDMLQKQKNIYKSIFIALFIILLISPYAIFNIGMQLSFLAVLGILMFKKEFEKILMLNNIKNKILKKIIKVFIENVSITFAVQLLIFPIQISAFNKISIPIILSNLLISIISIPVRVLGTIGILLSFISVLPLKIFSLTEFFVIVLLKIVNILKKISFSINIKTMPLVWQVIYYIFIIFLFLRFKLKRIMKRKGKYDFTKLYKKGNIISIVLLITVIVSMIVVNIYSIYFSQYVYFFNVEQGDMSYIKSKNESIIVDIGSLNESLAFYTISNFFKNENISSVDFIIISHFHADHINGLESFLQKYNVGEIVYVIPKEETEKYIKFKEIIQKYNIKTIIVKANDVIKLKNITIEVLLPEDRYILATDSENENSLVCKITVNKTSMLYMGDAGKIAEQKLYAKQVKDIDILKVGHHGSNSATSFQFIQSIKPKNAVISALKKYYGHPHQNVIQTLKENGVYIYYTEKSGAIKFNL